MADSKVKTGNMPQAGTRKAAPDPYMDPEAYPTSQQPIHSREVVSTDPVRVSGLPYGGREEFRGFRVPKGSTEEQQRYKEAVSARGAESQAESIENIMGRYGLRGQEGVLANEADRYLAGLYQSYHSAPSSELKDMYANLIRAETDPTIGATSVRSNAIAALTVGAGLKSLSPMGED